MGVKLNERKKGDRIYAEEWNELLRRAQGDFAAKRAGSLAGIGTAALNRAIAAQEAAAGTEIKWSRVLAVYADHFDCEEFAAGPTIRVDVLLHGSICPGGLITAVPRITPGISIPWLLNPFGPPPGFDIRYCLWPFICTCQSSGPGPGLGLEARVYANVSKMLVQAGMQPLSTPAPEHDPPRALTHDEVIALGNPFDGGCCGPPIL